MEGSGSEKDARLRCRQERQVTAVPWSFPDGIKTKGPARGRQIFRESKVCRAGGNSPLHAPGASCPTLDQQKFTAVTGSRGRKCG